MVTYGESYVPVNNVWRKMKKVKYRQKSKRKKKSSQQILKERYEAEDLNIGLLGEPFGKFDILLWKQRRKRSASFQKLEPQKQAKS